MLYLLVVSTLSFLCCLDGYWCESLAHQVVALGLCVWRCVHFSWCRFNIDMLGVFSLGGTSFAALPPFL